MKATLEPQEIKVKTVERTLMLLEILAEQNAPLSLTQIGHYAKLSLSTTYRLLQTLYRNGFVDREKTTGLYKLGFKSILIGNAAMQNMELRPTALPYLSQLVDCCNRSVYLGILTNQNMMYTDCVRNNNSILIGIQTGVPIPACNTGSGRVLIAYLPLSEQRLYVEYFLQNNFISDKESFFELLHTIKLKGNYIGSSGLGEMVREISVPVFNHMRDCIGAISIFESVVDNTQTQMLESLLTQLKETGQSISRAMGYSVQSIKQ